MLIFKQCASRKERKIADKKKLNDRHGRCVCFNDPLSFIKRKHLWGATSNDTLRLAIRQANLSPQFFILPKPIVCTASSFVWESRCFHAPASRPNPVSLFTASWTPGCKFPVSATEHSSISPVGKPTDPGLASRGGKSSVVAIRR